MTEIAIIGWFGRWGASVFSKNTAILEVYDIGTNYHEWSPMATISHEWSPRSPNVRTVVVVVVIVTKPIRTLDMSAQAISNCFDISHSTTKPTK